MLINADQAEINKIPKYLKIMRYYYKKNYITTTKP